MRPSFAAKDAIMMQKNLRANRGRVKLFQFSQHLFPPPHVPLAPRGYSLSKGVYEFPFTVRFPVLSACPEPHPGSSHVVASLPPSFQFKARDQRGFAKVHYKLEVEVKRPGRLHHNGLLEHSIHFLSLDPTLPPPMLSAATRRCQGLHLTLEAALPSPSILFLGSAIPLRLFVQILSLIHI